MLNGLKIIVCLPAYNASRTLTQTVGAIPRPLVDEVILVDDGSNDETVSVAGALGIDLILRHPQNRGYGANQKTCYRAALDRGADLIVMLHPDYQYNPALIPSLVGLIVGDVYAVALGSRILGKGALREGMPFHKYIANRFLTAVQNMLLGRQLSEYHTGYRAYRKEIFRDIAIDRFSDDFIFDNQLLAAVIYAGHGIGEISCPAHYFPEASSINFIRSVKYGFGVLYVSVLYRLNKWNLARSRIFQRPATAASKSQA